MSLARSALDLVYPRQCRLCGETRGCGQFSFLCDDCFTGASRLQPPWCEICGFPFSGEVSTPFQCPNCSEMKLNFDKAVAVMRFRGVVRLAIHGLKYSQQTYWFKVLRAWLHAGADALVDRSQIDCVIPIPLYPRRERERGFNQAWLLLQSITQKWKITSHRYALARVRETETQTHLDRQERMINLRGAFEVRQAGVVYGKRVLLVDDVLTTGSTANECSRVLREAGATSIFVFTLARG